MGGIGSGGHNRTHGTVEDTPRLDVNDPRDREVLRGLVHTTMKQSGRGRRQRRRYWICPLCGCTTVYLYQGQSTAMAYWCRVCAKLNYSSQQQRTAPPTGIDTPTGPG